MEGLVARGHVTSCTQQALTHEAELVFVNGRSVESERGEEAGPRVGVPVLCDAGHCGVGGACLVERDLDRGEGFIGTTDDGGCSARRRSVGRNCRDDRGDVGSWGCIDCYRPAQGDKVDSAERLVVEIADAALTEGVAVAESPPWQRLREDRRRICVACDGCHNVGSPDHRVEVIKVIKQALFGIVKGAEQQPLVDLDAREDVGEFAHLIPQRTRVKLAALKGARRATCEIGWTAALPHCRRNHRIHHHVMAKGDADVVVARALERHGAQQEGLFDAVVLDGSNHECRSPCAGGRMDVLCRIDDEPPAVRCRGKHLGVSQ